MKMKMRFGWPEVLGVLSVAICAVVLLAPREVLATAASDEVDTPTRDGRYIVIVQGSNTIYAGTMVCADSSGLAEHATDAASKKVIGRAEVTQDNTGSSYSSTRTIKIRTGIFRWTNGDSFTDANIGDLAYVEDNQTVQTAASASSDSIAGVIVDVDDDGVWVDTGDIGSQGAGSLTTLTTSGAASLGSTLAVTSGSTLSSTLYVAGTTSLQALNATGAVNCASTVKVTGATTLSNTLDVASTVTAAKQLATTPATQTLDPGDFTLTVTNSLIILQPCGIATVALANATAAGYMCTLINNTATNVVLNDSGNLSLTGTVTLAQWDSLTVKAATTSRWVLTGACDN